MLNYDRQGKITKRLLQTSKKLLELMRAMYNLFLVSKNNWGGGQQKRLHDCVNPLLQSTDSSHQLQVNVCWTTRIVTLWEQHRIASLRYATI